MKWRVGGHGGAGEALWRTSGNLAAWSKSLKLYPRVINEMVRTSKTKKKTGATNKYSWGEKYQCIKTLKKNDIWWHSEFGELMSTGGCCSKEDLKKMLQWKWSRGKYRPGRTRFQDHNHNEDVKETTRQTLKILSPLDDDNEGGELKPDEIDAIVTEAIQCAQSMPQVGPATATAILAAYVPKFCPMYADESMESVGMYREPYTCARYCEYAGLLRQKAKELGGEWDANMVADALFAASKADQLGILEGEEGGGGGGGGGGGSESVRTKEECGDDVERPKKRSKKK